MAANKIGANTILFGRSRDSRLSPVTRPANLSLLSRQARKSVVRNCRATDGVSGPGTGSLRNKFRCRAITACNAKIRLTLNDTFAKSWIRSRAVADLTVRASGSAGWDRQRASECGGAHFVERSRGVGSGPMALIQSELHSIFIDFSARRFHLWHLSGGIGYDPVTRGFHLLPVCATCKGSGNRSDDRRWCPACGASGHQREM